MLEWVAIAVFRDLPDPGTEPRLPALQADASLSEPPGGAQVATVIKSLPAGAVDSTDVGPFPGSGRFLGEGNDNPLQYSRLGNPVNRVAWWNQKVRHN